MGIEVLFQKIVDQAEEMFKLYDDKKTKAFIIDLLEAIEQIPDEDVKSVYETLESNFDLPEGMKEEHAVELYVLARDAFKVYTAEELKKKPQKVSSKVDLKRDKKTVIEEDHGKKDEKRRRNEDEDSPPRKSKKEKDSKKDDKKDSKKPKKDFTLDRTKKTVNKEENDLKYRKTEEASFLPGRSREASMSMMVSQTKKDPKGSNVREGTDKPNIQKITATKRHIIEADTLGFDPKQNVKGYECFSMKEKVIYVNDKVSVAFMHNLVAYPSDSNQYVLVSDPPWEAETQGDSNLVKWAFYPSAMNPDDERAASWNEKLAWIPVDRQNPPMVSFFWCHPDQVQHYILSKPDFNSRICSVRFIDPNSKTESHETLVIMTIGSNKFPTHVTVKKEKKTMEKPLVTELFPSHFDDGQLFLYAFSRSEIKACLDGKIKSVHFSHDMGSLPEKSSWTQMPFSTPVVDKSVFERPSSLTLRSMNMRDVSLQKAADHFILNDMVTGKKTKVGPKDIETLLACIVSGPLAIYHTQEKLFDHMVSLQCLLSRGSGQFASERDDHGFLAPEEKVEPSEPTMGLNQPVLEIEAGLGKK